MLCRLCAYECLSENANELESNLQTLIAKYLFIETAQNDDSPATIICMSCRKRLEDFDDFFKTIEERQKVLQQIIKNVKKEKDLEGTEHEFSIEIASICDVKEERELDNINCYDNIDNTTISSSIPEHLEFSYVACDTTVDEDIDVKDDILLPSKLELVSPGKKSEEIRTKELAVESQRNENEDILLPSKFETKVSVAKRIPAANVQRAALARHKLKTKKSKEIKLKADTSKRNAPSPEEEKKKDELLAKYASFECELCQAKSETYKQFQSHFQKYHKQKAYIICCGQHFNKRSRIIDHLQSHENPDHFQCEICKKKLKTKTSLIHHTKLFHTRNELNHSCHVCGKTFAYRSMLETHMSVHNSIRNHICELCEKGFKSKFALKWHTKNMHGERVIHICDICGKEFRIKLSFEQHVAEHQGLILNKKKQCHVCDVWVAATYFKRHVQRHEAVEAVCDICEKKFSSIPALVSHKERNHRNLKEYGCPYCEKTFVRPRNLKEHIDLHTGHKEYSCKFCPQEFRSKANMYAHQKKMHHELWAQEQLKRTQAPDYAKKD